MMLEDDIYPVLFILGLILLMATHSWGQNVATSRPPDHGEDCKHCPVDLAAQFPEAPSTTKPHFFNKKWLTAEAIHGAAISFDSYETASHEGRCALEGNNGFPENVGAKELAFNGAVEWGFGWFIRELAYRAPRSFQWISYMTPVYGTALHLHGGIQWYQRCN